MAFSLFSNDLIDEQEGCRVVCVACAQHGLESSLQVFLLTSNAPPFRQVRTKDGIDLRNLRFRECQVSLNTRRVPPLRLSGRPDAAEVTVKPTTARTLTRFMFHT
jgi:hypothetical protein